MPWRGIPPHTPGHSATRQVVIRTFLTSLRGVASYLFMQGLPCFNVPKHFFIILLELRCICLPLLRILVVCLAIGNPSLRVLLPTIAAAVLMLHFLPSIPPPPLAGAAAAARKKKRPGVTPNHKAMLWRQSFTTPMQRLPHLLLPQHKCAIHTPS